MVCGFGWWLYRLRRRRAIAQALELQERIRHDGGVHNQDGIEGGNYNQQDARINGGRGGRVDRAHDVYHIHVGPRA